ncbi:MAG: aldehyde dehydrogenase family protein [Bryobacterales bacterium]|jgi:aldehyde dehydrogenase (NAD+)|nr:aldehyde dehydrogenase family protein [Bryobacterales bacterium]
MSADPSAILDALQVAPDCSGVCGKHWVLSPAGEWLPSFNPSTGRILGRVCMGGVPDYEKILADATEVAARWRLLPAPLRGEVVRQIGEELRAHKQQLGALVSLEMGKILVEGEGEVQEMIDMADFATGLSRQLYGLSMHSERPGHRMFEQWHPLGIVGVITAFNFPVAVWAWNALLAAVCGNVVVWKPSPATPLCAIAVQQICNRVLARHGFPGVFQLIVGDTTKIGERMVADRRIPLISATGSTAMGKRVGEVVAQRLGRSLLELGGNNAIIVMHDADLALALRAVMFGAVGTSGQRCTTTRRLFLHQAIADSFIPRLVAAYQQVPIGDPLDGKTLMGPLINAKAVAAMREGIREAQQQGAQLLYGGEPLPELGECFVRPAILRVQKPIPLMRQEIFAPILYVCSFVSLEDAIRMQNDVPQGLSSAIFTRGLQASEQFLSPAGSDCGIANVNIGTSGAEIGGAFGGEKDTGGGRESGSDSWKAYMRRQTVTVNYSDALPLAQGITFGEV